MLSFTLQTNAQVPLIANVVDQLGGPAQAPELISWSIADETVASLDESNGSSVNLIAHAEGATTVAVTVGSLTTILHITIVPTVASAVSIDIGTPVAKAVAELAPVEAPTAEHHAEAANDEEHVEVPVSAEHIEPVPHDPVAHQEPAPVIAIAESVPVESAAAEPVPAASVEAESPKVEVAKADEPKGEEPKGEAEGREAAEHSAQPAHDAETADDKTESAAA